MGEDIPTMCDDIGFCLIRAFISGIPSTYCLTLHFLTFFLISEGACQYIRRFDEEIQPTGGV